MLDRIKEKKTFLAVSLLVIICLVVYHIWFFSSAILTHGDWPFAVKKAIIDHYGNFAWIWRSDESFGGVSLDAGQGPTYLIYSFVVKVFGANFAFAERLVHLWPAALVTPLASFLLLRRYFKSHTAAVVGAIVYSFNTYFLILESGQLTLMAAYAFAPLAIYFFTRLLDERSLVNVVKLALSMAIVAAYEPRSFYIVCVVVMLYAAYALFFDVVKDKFRLTLYTGLAFSIVGLINIYWVLSLQQIGSLSNNELFSRGLFGSSFFNLKEAFTLFHPYWTGTDYTPFIVQSIPIYFWLIPILAALGLITNRRKKIVILYAFIGIIGVFLSKQADQPFSGFYQWAYNHIPGFNAFREASKFYFMIALAYSVLIGFFVDWMVNNKSFIPKKNLRYLAYAVPCLIAFLFLFNARSFVDGSIKTLFVARHMPAEYVTLNNFIEKDTQFSRILWLPSTSRWALFGNTHPRINSADISQSALKNLYLDNSNASGSLPLQAQITGLFNKPYALDIMNAASVKYVIVPLRDETNDDDSFKFYNNDRSYYLNVLNQTSWLKKLDIHTGDIAVYENKTFTPFISTSSNLIELDKVGSLDNSYPFIKNELKNNSLNFTTADSTRGVPSEKLIDLFTNIGPSNLKDGIITAQKLPTKLANTTLYANTTQQALSYQWDENKLTFFNSDLNKLEVNNQAIGLDQPKKIVLSKTTQPNTAYYLNNEDSLSGLNKDSSGNIGIVKTERNLFSSSGKNLVQNYSFEQGTWQNRVDDCNHYNNQDPRLAMSLVKDGANGTKNALGLSAGLHTACTSSSAISISSASSLKFSFDYKADRANHIGYKLIYNDPNHTVVNEQINRISSNWRTFSRLVTAPRDATSVVIQLLAFPGEQLISLDTTFYDNISLEPLAYETSIAATPTTTYQPMPVKRSDVIQYDDTSYRFNNLIPNPSFESGTWQEKVGDCNSYDDKPNISMSVNKKNPSEGKQSLELDSTNHTACTSQSGINVEGNANYLFSFDYASPNGENAGYYIGFDDPARTSISKQLSIVDSKWNTFNTNIQVPSDAKKMSLTIYSYSDTTGTKKVITKYDNFHFIKIPKIENSYYLSSRPDIALKNPLSTDFKMINPTKYAINIKNASNSFYLNMSESFHPKWRLDIDNSKLSGLGDWLPNSTPDAINDDSHFKLNDFENGWYIDTTKICEQQNYCFKNTDGSYNIKLVAEFTPQRWFNVGVTISGITFISCIAFLSIKLHQKKSTKNNSKL